MTGPETLLLIAFCILAETGSVLCFKRGVDRDEESPLVTGFIRMIATQPLLWLGIALWATELVAWIVVLEDTPLSVAYPLMSLIYCVVPLAGRLLLKEALPKHIWLAGSLIAVGVALVGSTEL